ncbi:MAG: hypothetical protein ACYDHY_09460 [Acidiferrobacterales bacterium]
MKIRFDKAVRKSLAQELKLTSWRGSGVALAINWISKSAIIMIVAVSWWVLFQSLAHLLIAIEDTP